MAREIAKGSILITLHKRSAFGYTGGGSTKPISLQVPPEKASTITTAKRMSGTHQ